MLDGGQREFLIKKKSGNLPGSPSRSEYVTIQMRMVIALRLASSDRADRVFCPL